MDAKDQLEEVTRNALDYNLRHPSALIKLERKKSLLQAKLWAKQLQLQENALQESLPTSMQKVLAGKRLLLWEKLLRKYDYDDLGVVEFMKQGVRLVGAHSEAPCYPPLVRPATLTESDLRNLPTALPGCWGDLGGHPGGRLGAWATLGGKMQYIF